MSFKLRVLWPEIKDENDGKYVLSNENTFLLNSVAYLVYVTNLRISLSNLLPQDSTFDLSKALSALSNANLY